MNTDKDDVLIIFKKENKKNWPIISFIILILITLLFCSIVFNIDVEASTSNNIENIGIDYDFIFDVTDKLSETIFLPDHGKDENDIYKGRSYGTVGEWYAKNLVVNWMFNNTNNLTLNNDIIEEIIGDDNYGLSRFNIMRKLNNMMEILDYSIDLREGYSNPPDVIIPNNESFPYPKYCSLYGYNVEHTIKTNGPVKIEWPPIGHEDNPQNGADIDFSAFNLNVTKYTIPFSLLYGNGTVILGNLTYLDDYTNASESEKRDQNHLINVSNNEYNDTIDQLTNDNASGFILIRDDISDVKKWSIDIPGIAISQENGNFLKNLSQNGTICIFPSEIMLSTDTGTLEVYHCTDNITCLEKKVYLVNSSWFENNYVKFMNNNQSYINPVTLKINYLVFSAAGFLICDPGHPDTHFQYPYSYHGAGERDSFSTLIRPMMSINGSVMVNGKMKDVWTWVEENYNSENPVTVNFSMAQRKNPNVESYNVYCDVQGYDTDETFIMSGGHYEAWWGQMTSDNAVGVAQMMGILKYINDYSLKPNRNLRFIFHGGHEHLVRGSLSHVFNSSNYNVLKNSKYIINLDQLGHDSSPATFRINTSMSNIIGVVFRSALNEIIDPSNYEDKYGDKGYDVRIGKKQSNGTIDCIPYTFGYNFKVLNPVNLDYINFCKDSLKQYHRTGNNHTLGDTMNIVDQEDINATVDIIWNVTRYFVFDPHCWFDVNPEYLIWDSDDDGKDDSANVTFSVSTSFPQDRIRVKPLLIHQIFDNFTQKWVNDPFHIYADSEDYVITPTSGISENITLTLPGNAPAGKYKLKVYVFNSTGGVNIILSNNFLSIVSNLLENIFNITLDFQDWEYVNNDLSNDSYLFGTFQMQPANTAPTQFTSIYSTAQTTQAGTAYAYTTSATDPENNPLYYQFEFGNTIHGYEYSPWLGPFNSGENCTIKHKWVNTGNMTIRARARDNLFTSQMWTNWTSPLNKTVESGCSIINSPSLMLVNRSYPLQSIVYGFNSENWTWNWGEESGSANFTCNASNIYEETGNYTVNLTTRDNQSNNYYFNLDIQVLPIISDFLVVDEAKKPSEQIEFYDWSISENTIINWTWNLGDGNISYSKNISHNFSLDGKYNVTLTVIDTQNNTHTSYQTIYIDSISPSIISGFYNPHPITDEELPITNYYGPVGRGNNVTFYANFFDNLSGVDITMINITYPNGSSSDLTMYTNSGNSYDYEYTFSDTTQIGVYNCIIKVIDKSNNSKHALSHSFTVDHLFGNMLNGNQYQNMANRISGTIFTACANGTADNITALIQTNQTIPPKTKCMIYKASDSTLIGTTEELTYNTGNQSEWVTFNFTEPKPQLIENTEYVLTCWSNDTCHLYYDNTLDDIGRYKNETYGNSPNPVNWTDNESRIYSICCFYTTSPEITNVCESPVTVGFGFNVTINADVEDFGGGSTVSVNISFPNDSTGNFSMNLVGNNTYEYVFVDTWLVGQYNYTIWVVDWLGNSNSSTGHFFNVSSQATISVCTIKDEYGENETVNLTDPPGEPPVIGYKLLDDDQVLHMWNSYNSYYFNTSNGIQFTNHKDEYWTHNVLMLGYYNNDAWNLIYRTDELSGFTKNVTSDNETYVNATLWKNLSYGGYDFRLAIRYYLGVYDADLTVIPYIKNIDNEDIPYVLGFGWEMKNIRIANVTSDNYIHIYNGSSFVKILLNQTLDSSYTNMGNHTVIRLICTDPLTFHLSRDLYLSWNKNLTYKVTVKSRIGQDNAPVTLFIRVGNLSIGQYKSTKMHWLDSDDWLGISSSEYDSHCGDNNGHTLEEALDGTDYWYHMMTSGHNHNFVLDLGQTYTVKKFRGRSFRASDPIDVDIYVSDNKSDWGTAVVSGISSWQDTGSWQIVDLAKYKHGRYIKVEVQDTEHFLDYIEWGGSFGPPYMTIFDVYAGIEPLANYPVPTNGSSGISISPYLNITVSDAEGDNMNITWYSNSSGSWQIFGTNISVGNGTYHQTFSNASENGKWWYWYVNVTDVSDNSFNSDIFAFYTGNQSKVKNTGSTDIKGYILVEVEYYNSSLGNWTIVDDTVNETTSRTISSGGQFGLDTIFNGLINTSSLLDSFGNGTYRVYASFRDPDGDVLVCDDESLLESTYEFTITSS